MAGAAAGERRGAELLDAGRDEPSAGPPSRDSWCLVPTSSRRRAALVPGPPAWRPCQGPMAERAAPSSRPPHDPMVRPRAHLRLVHPSARITAAGAAGTFRQDKPLSRQALALFSCRISRAMTTAGLCRTKEYAGGPSAPYRTSGCMLHMYRCSDTVSLYVERGEGGASKSVAAIDCTWRHAGKRREGRPDV